MQTDGLLHPAFGPGYPTRVPIVKRAVTEPQRPGFINPIDGFSCVPDHQEWRLWIFPTTIWRFKVNQEAPLMFRRPCGDLLKMIETSGFTDFGSIPVPLRGLPGLSETRFARPYLFHDGDYTEHAVLVSRDGGSTWEHTIISRQEADAFLLEMIQFDVDPGGKCLRNTIWSQVRMWGKRPWIDDHRKDRRRHWREQHMARLAGEAKTIIPA